MKERVKGGNKRWLHYDKPTPNSVRERNIAVTSYYNQQTIDIAAERPSVRLTPATIMYASITADKKHDNIRNRAVNMRSKPLCNSFRFNFWIELGILIGEKTKQSHYIDEDGVQECTVPTQGAAHPSGAQDREFPQSPLHSGLQPHHPCRPRALYPGIPHPKRLPRDTLQRRRC